MGVADSAATAQHQFKSNSRPASPRIEESGFTVYLPVLNRAEDFQTVDSIWSPTPVATKQQVTLFRHQFWVQDGQSSEKLEIFADTRYEVWLDGTWLGRGPARFSRQLHEYDVYTLGDLSPGNHTLAVLVQWAPNLRRSESTRPYLQARLTGKSGSKRVILAQTGPYWKTLSTTAWNPEAAQVHRWNLIGPTELLDLNKLPSDWMEVNFPDTSWEYAQVVSNLEQIPLYGALWVMDPAAGGGHLLPDLEIRPRLPSASADLPLYRPRSIDFLDYTPIPLTLTDAGFLAVGKQLRELTAQAGSSFVQDLAANVPQSITLDTVATAGPPAADLALVNGNPLTWQPYHPDFPDLYRAEASLAAGLNQLSVAHMPAGGLTMAATGQGDIFSGLGMLQGEDAGRRLLLAEPTSDPAAVTITPGTTLFMSIAQAPAYALFDLGRTVHGRVSFIAEGPQGSLIDVGWDERLYPGTQRALPYPGSLHAEWDQVDSWILDGTPRAATTLDARAGRYLLIAAWGPGPVQLSHLQVLEETYPLDVAGSFTSQDDLLNEIWQVGADTLRINMTDAYTDTPWRERGQWWGDAYVESQINVVTYGDLDLLARGVILMSAAGPSGEIFGLAPNGAGTSMLDYGMLWIQSVKEVFASNAHPQILYRVYPQVVNYLEFTEQYLDPATGLIDLPDEHWSQTAYIDTRGYRDRRGQSTAINALYAQTLLDAADLAAAMGRWSDMVTWMARSAAVRSAINTRLYQPTLHRYAATIENNEVYPATVLAQAWALSYDIVPQENVPGVVQAMLELLGSDPENAPVGTYGFYWVLRALGENGYVDEGLNLIRTFYGAMLNKGATTWWEWFEADRYYSNSLSHGWAGSPTWFLSTYALGLHAEGPQSWGVHLPVSQQLHSLSGSLPTQAGVVSLTWQETGCGEFEVTVTSPKNSQGRLVLPSGDGSTSVTIDGTIHEPAQIDEPLRPASPMAGSVYLIDGGSHRLFIQSDCREPHAEQPVP